MLGVEIAASGEFVLGGFALNAPAITTPYVSAGFAIHAPVGCTAPGTGTILNFSELAASRR